MSDRGVPVSFLRELFDVDPAAGALTWRIRPQAHFPDRRSWAVINSRNGGKPAGHLDDRMYVVLCFNHGGRRIKTYAHRVIWALAHGRWPTHTIDHIDGPEAGNGIGNLREATRAEQPKNMAKRDSETGLRGAYRNGPGFQAKLKHEGIVYRFGQFKTAEEAHRAYLEGRRKLNTFQPIPRDG
jgi:hypothetical protein